MIKRPGAIQFSGKPASIVGVDLTVGQTASAFRCLRQDWSVYRPLTLLKKQVKIIAAVPSLDTAVCDRETRRFNEEAANLSELISILVISADLPFAQKRWCGAAGIDRLEVVSDHRWLDFGKKYACLIWEPGILRRAIFVLDANNQIRYAAYMPKLGDEPDYAAVLAAARSLL